MNRVFVDRSCRAKGLRCRDAKRVVNQQAHEFLFIQLALAAELGNRQPPKAVGAGLG